MFLLYQYDRFKPLNLQVHKKLLWCLVIMNKSFTSTSPFSATGSMPTHEICTCPQIMPSLFHGDVEEKTPVNIKYVAYSRVKM